ncbi:bromodomain-containing protein DDB_G0280777-like [Rhopalosiphum maidis]|uniref:bromodomain-containing protein DDB_G0280777-like n=1 Tax=Rhopalosiphum maidis TaxID=43146 RepID=UPI000EFFAE97|nr:bromodomain-containing protein DDB_G0280777-like [Rhopalosiphum maidis]
MKFVSVCLVLMVAALRGGVLSVSTENNYNEQEVTLEDLSSISKRQTNFQNNNFNRPQIPQEYFEFTPQANYDGNLVPEQPQFEQQNAQQQVFLQGLPSDVFPPTTTTTKSPFTAEQIRLQEEYSRRTLVEQQTALLRSRQKFLAQPLQTQPSVIPEQQPLQPLQFIDQNGQIRQQNLGLQQQNFAPQQQDLVSQQQSVASVSNDEPFSYAQVQFGPVTKQAETVVSRPKGQRSVSRPRTNYAVEPATQQTIDYPAVAAANPVQVNSRLLQNVVYIQPNGQMYKAIEDTEQVVQIPRKNNYYQTVSAVTSGPTTSATSITPLTSSTTTADPVEEEQVIIIPRPKKLNQRPRHEGRKSSRVQQQTVRTEKPQQQQDQQPQQQQSSEVEPDNFLTSLLSRFQQTQPETTVATLPKSRGSTRPKSGNRSGTSKYLPDRNQLQLLQFPHELKALSTAELKVLQDTSAQIAAANDKSVGQKQLLQNTQVTGTEPPSPSPSSVQLNERFILGNRPVPMPVELSEQQRQFLAAQGIRHLYRVDYDQSGNELPLTYVLALDNRPKLAELRQKP